MIYLLCLARAITASNRCCPYNNGSCGGHLNTGHDFEHMDPTMSESSVLSGDGDGGGCSTEFNVDTCAHLSGPQPLRNRQPHLQESLTERPPQFRTATPAGHHRYGARPLWGKSRNYWCMQTQRSTKRQKTVCRGRSSFIPGFSYPSTGNSS